MTALYGVVFQDIQRAVLDCGKQIRTHTTFHLYRSPVVPYVYEYILYGILRFVRIIQIRGSIVTQRTVILLKQTFDRLSVTLYYSRKCP